MTTALASAVELLDRSLGYTRVALAGVDDAWLSAATPCQDWTLRDLLDHMGDSLDAFAEAAGGNVELTRSRAASRAVVLQQKACALMGLWSGESPPGVRVGGVDLATDLLVATAALEISVHGWDVSQATGVGTPIPEDLARHLLPIAHLTVSDCDRGIRFAEALPEPVDATAEVRLRAFLGRG